MKKHKIAVVINQKSGSKTAKKKRDAVIDFVNKEKKLELFIPKSVEETANVTKELAEKNYEAVFACGGDGTLNVVSSQLIGTDTAMAIIPMGSGNGYARHHKISMHWEKALQNLDNYSESIRDTGIVNGLHFLNIAGMGYAAKVSKAFANNEKRGLAGYVTTVLTNLKLNPFNAKLINADGVWEGQTWMVDFCNGSQWGNNISIEPGARDDDGSLTAVVFQKISPLKVPIIGFRIATSNTENSIDIYKLNGDKFILAFEGKQHLHIDGEYAGEVEKEIAVEVNPKSLKLWKPFEG